VFLSSIFNFESLRGIQPKVPVTLLAVAGIVVLLETAMRLTPERAIIPGKSRQAEMRFLETDVLEKFPEPKIVLLGSSRIRRAVVPRLLDETLGLPQYSTMNLGLASGRLFEAQYFYEQNFDTLKSAKLVVLALDEWHLSTGWRLGSVYEFHAPWAERIALPDPLRTRMIMDGLFSMRLKLRMFFPAMLTHLGVRKAQTPELALTDDYQVLPKPRKGLPPDINPQEYHKTIDTFYESFNVHPVMEGHVEAIAKKVKEAGGQLVLLQLPNRMGYQTQVEKLRGEQYRQHIESLKKLAEKLNVPVYIYRLPEECGLSDENYEDYGHINREGAKLFTRFIAPILQKHMPAKSE
jgi:hypothetical protein